MTNPEVLSTLFPRQAARARRQGVRDGPRGCRVHGTNSSSVVTSTANISGTQREGTWRKPNTEFPLGDCLEINTCITEPQKATESKIMFPKLNLNSTYHKFMQEFHFASTNYSIKKALPSQKRTSESGLGWFYHDTETPTSEDTYEDPLNPEAEAWDVQWVALA